VQLLINPKPIGGVKRERRRLEEEFEKDEPEILPCTDCEPSNNDEDFIP